MDGYQRRIPWQAQEGYPEQGSCGLQSFFKTPGKIQPERAASQPAESPQTAQKPQHSYLEIFSPAPVSAR